MTIVKGGVPPTPYKNIYFIMLAFCTRKVAIEDFKIIVRLSFDLN